MNTKPSTTNRGCVVGVVLLFSMLIWSVLPIDVRAQQSQTSITTYLPLILKPSGGPQYVLVAWNDLGMHCYNRDFSSLAVLPPYNNLWAQVIRRGDPPQIVSDNIQVTYLFPDNTYSVEKSNFWDYAQDLFNLGTPLTPNIGLTGVGMAGEMAFNPTNNAFIVEGIPLTEFRDSDPSTPYPYQLAEIAAKNATTGTALASLTVVAPVSTEMTCNDCHSDNGRGNEGISTGDVEINILTKHDDENSEDYPVGGEYGNSLVGNQPVLCADCHSSNALGLPGAPGLPSLSNAMHTKHAEIDPPQPNCYQCHPGPTTQCLRDVMSTQYGMTCEDCHGALDVVAQNPDPWLQEPRCDGCHTGAGYEQNNALYRHSTGHGGVYCEACHDSTHAIAPSNQGNDGIKFTQLQNAAGPLTKCTVCHLTDPGGTNPHDVIP